METWGDWASFFLHTNAALDVQITVQFAWPKAIGLWLFHVCHA